MTTRALLALAPGGGDGRRPATSGGEGAAAWTAQWTCSRSCPRRRHQAWRIPGPGSGAAHLGRRWRSPSLAAIQPRLLSTRLTRRWRDRSYSPDGTGRPLVADGYRHWPIELAPLAGRGPLIVVDDWGIGGHRGAEVVVDHNLGATLAAWASRRRRTLLGQRYALDARFVRPVETGCPTDRSSPRRCIVPYFGGRPSRSRRGVLRRGCRRRRRRTRDRAVRRRRRAGPRSGARRGRSGGDRGRDDDGASPVRGPPWPCRWSTTNGGLGHAVDAGLVIGGASDDSRWRVADDVVALARSATTRQNWPTAAGRPPTAGAVGSRPSPEAAG